MMASSKLVRDYPFYLYLALPCLYICLLVTKANFGWDGNELLWRIGVTVAFLLSCLISKRILTSTPPGVKRPYAKAFAALVVLPLVIHLLGIAIINNAPGIGASF
jgi:hypothetical protein